MEYFLWPLEIASYWFMPENDKMDLLLNPVNIEHWLSESLIYGSAFGGAGAVTVTTGYLVDEM